MNMADLRKRNTTELKSELIDLLRSKFNLRMQLSTQQSNKTHQIRNIRRDIARIRTILHQPTV